MRRELKKEMELLERERDDALAEVKWLKTLVDSLQKLKKDL